MNNLTAEEVDAILDVLGKFTVMQMLNQPSLASAIMKLNGTPLSIPCGAPGAYAEVYPQVEVWAMSGSFVSLIKAIRQLTGYGLKEAKDFVEDLGGRSRSANGVIQDRDSTIIIKPREMGITDRLFDVRQKVGVTMWAVS